MRRTAAIWVLVALVALAGCMPGKLTLTDQDVGRYVRAHRAIRAAAPQVAESIQRGGVPGAEDLAKLDAAVKQAGFKDYTEFAKVNAAVAWAFSQTKAGSAVKGADDAVKAAATQIDRQLADPNVPAAVKERLRAQKAQIEQQHAKNKGWAGWATSLGGALTDEASIAVVKRHEREIQAVLMGR